MTNQLKIKKLLLMEAAEDYVGLWSVIVEIEDYNPKLDTVSIKNQCLKLIRELLNDNLIEVGTFNSKSQFEIWQMSNTEIISRIEKEWNQLNREPNIGDIAWFISTKKGELESKSLENIIID